MSETQRSTGLRADGPGFNHHFVTGFQICCAVLRKGKLEGILCLDEIVLHAQRTELKKGISYEDVVNTMKAICEHRATPEPKPSVMAAGATPVL